jgi:hypothetical protein
MKYLFMAFALCLGIAAFSAFDAPQKDDVSFSSPAKPQQYAFPLDTMSAAGTTYKNVPWNMASPYQYQYFVKLRKISGTPNVKIRLEERNTATSSIWSAIDSVSCSGADSVKLFFRLKGAVTYGASHRIAFVKTGTNTMARNIELNIKPTN